MTNDRFHKLFGGPPRRPESPLEQRHMDLAASIQAVTEEIVLNMAREAHRLTGKKNLVLAGGVALNCVANGHLLREGTFSNLWVQPAAGDAGGAVGAALFSGINCSKTGAGRKSMIPSREAFLARNSRMMKSPACLMRKNSPPKIRQRSGIAGRGRRAARRRKNRRLVSWPDGIRAARALAPEAFWATRAIPPCNR